MKMASMILGRQVLCLMAFALLASSSPAGRGSRVVLRDVAFSVEQASLPTQPAVAAPEEQYLVEHNAARAAVKVGPLRWSPKLAATASRLVRYQRAEKRCNFADLPDSRKYGANQGWAGLAAWPVDAVRMWADGAKYYSYANDTCASGHECGTYTQVVWRNTAEVGCAQAACGSKGPTVTDVFSLVSNVRATYYRKKSSNTTLTICLYFPAGNVVGEKPY